MTSGITLLETKQWLGQFWFPGDGNSRFPGLLEYSPTEGIHLSLFRPEDNTWPLDSDDNFPVILGTTIETGALTLFSALRLGWEIATAGLGERYWCESAVLGGHFLIESRFVRCRFAPNNLNEFFHPQNAASLDTYGDKPVLTTGATAVINASGERSSPLTMTVGKAMTGSYQGAPSSHLALNADTEGDLARDLDHAFETVLLKHGRDSPPPVKREVTYHFTLEALRKPGATLSEILQAVRDVSKLFSLLCLRLARPTTIRVQSELDSKFLTVLLPPHLDEKSLARLTKDKSRLRLPVTSDAIGVDFTEIMKRWFETIRSTHDIICPALLSHLYEEAVGLQDYVLLMAAIEQCCHLEDGLKTQSFIDAYAPPATRARILQLLPGQPEDDQIGRQLGDLRNCIAHPAKLTTRNGRQYQRIISSMGIFNLADALFLTLLGWLYHRLGLHDESIRKFEQSVERHFVYYVDR